MVLKVVRLFDARKLTSIYGTAWTRRMEVKDQAGARMKITIFRNHCNYEQMEVNSVYFITKLKMDKYPLVRDGPFINIYIQNYSFLGRSSF